MDKLDEIINLEMQHLLERSDVVKNIVENSKTPRRTLRSFHLNNFYANIAEDSEKSRYSYRKIARVFVVLDKKPEFDEYQSEIRLNQTNREFYSVIDQTLEEQSSKWKYMSVKKLKDLCNNYQRLSERESSITERYLWYIYLDLRRKGYTKKDITE